MDAGAKRQRRAEEQKKKESLEAGDMNFRI
jgi:hypothetical protein